jgi:hypothetical protein
MSRITRRLPRLAIALSSLVLGLSAVTANAANSNGCEGGGFAILGHTAQGKLEVPVSQLGARFAVKGKYVEFEVDPVNMAVYNYTMTGAANKLDITGGVRTPVFASKVADLGGVPLTGTMTLQLVSDGSFTMARGDSGVTITLTGKDCAQGGIFQMETERADGATTLVTHTLATSTTNANLTPFYFDNRNFRAREGDVVPFADSTITITARTNIGNDFSSKFVLRDSVQDATRRAESTCVNSIINRFGQPVTVKQCGAVTRFDVLSGGRLGQVMGEDGTEVAPAAAACASHCKAADQVKGAALTLGFPFPVSVADRFQPRLPTN